MSDDAILNELKHMRSDFQKMDQRMAGIETAMNVVAVQAQQISTLDRDVTKLFDIKDECSREMVEIKQFQSSCPRGTIEKDIKAVREDVKESVRNQWVAIAVLASGLIAMAGWIKIGVAP
jgi:predicted  nucleic acid-binding Zn-ribbon protein